MNKILVTGVRRSGTTFVGKVLAKAPSTSYIFEPLNCDIGIKGFSNIWYPYLSDDSITEEQKELLDCAFNSIKIKFSNTLYGQGRSINNASFFDYLSNVFTNFSEEKLALRIGKTIFKSRSHFEYFRHKYALFSHENFVFKDPLAALSAGFLSDKYKLKVVVMLKHPYSYFYSMKKQNWGVDPRKNFLGQEDLLPIIEPFVTNALSHYENSIALYSLLEYWVVYKLLLKEISNPNFYFIRLEDIAADPVGKFSDLFKFLELEYSNETIKFIHKSTSENNSTKAKEVSNTIRNSNEVINSWKGKLSTNEMKLTQELCFELSKEFYPKDEW